MNNNEVKKLLVEVPARICRNMNRNFINSILRQLPVELSHHNYAILMLLAENDSLIISDIVESLSITKPQMTASVDRLAELGYIGREVKKGDRRKVSLSITGMGRGIISEINGVIDSRIDAILEELSPDDVAALERGLKVLQNVCSISMKKHYDS